MRKYVIYAEQTVETTIEADDYRVEHGGVLTFFKGVHPIYSVKDWHSVTAITDDGNPVANFLD